MDRECSCIDRNRDSGRHAKREGGCVQVAAERIGGQEKNQGQVLWFEMESPAIAGLCRFGAVIFQRFLMPRASKGVANPADSAISNHPEWPENRRLKLYRDPI